MPVAQLRIVRPHPVLYEIDTTSVQGIEDSLALPYRWVDYPTVDRDLLAAMDPFGGRWNFVLFLFGSRDSIFWVVIRWGLRGSISARHWLFSSLIAHLAYY